MSEAITALDPSSNYDKDGFTGKSIAIGISYIIEYGHDCNAVPICVGKCCVKITKVLSKVNNLNFHGVGGETLGVFRACKYFYINLVLRQMNSLLIQT